MTTHHTAFDLISDLSIAGLHTGVTLWHRLPMLAIACTPFGRHHQPEMHRMVSEKTEALLDGVTNAQHEMGRLTIAALTGHLDFDAFPHVGASVAAAGLQPAFYAVKSNSQRLSQRIKHKAA